MEVSKYISVMNLSATDSKLQLSNTKMQYLELFQSAVLANNYKDQFDNMNSVNGAFNRKDLLYIQQKLMDNKKNTNSFKSYLYGDNSKMKPNSDSWVELEYVFQELNYIQEKIALYFLGDVLLDDPEEPIHHIELVIKYHNYFIFPVGTATLAFSDGSQGTQYYTKNKQRIFATDIARFSDSDNIWFDYQADSVSCGPYAYAYGKQLMNYDQRELRRYSLCLHIQTESTSSQAMVFNFFLPSPSCLKYAQSSKYIDFLLAILDDNPDASKKTDKTIYSLINKMNSKTANTTILYLDEDGLLQPLSIEYFCKFRSKWLEEFTVQMKSRDKMSLLLTDSDKPQSKSIECVRVKIKQRLK